MRRLSRYIIREVAYPFLLSLLIIIFILFLNFLLRAIDKFLGKGLDILTVLEYLFLNLAWIVALATPMAVLIAILMTFGRMSEDNEINALRASGISFFSILRPAVIFGILIAVLLTYFNNFILPEMNFRARLLSGDIYRKRPGMNIEPGHFIDDLPDYSMIIRGKTGETMNDVRIFSKANEESQTSIHSNSGDLHTIDDAIILTLYDGEIHELDIQDYANYRRIQFKKHRILLAVDNLSLNRRDSSARTDREMTIPMMLAKQRSYDNRIKVVQKRLSRSFKRITGDSLAIRSIGDTQKAIQDYRTQLEQDTVISSTEKHRQKRRVNSLERQVKNEFNLIASYNKTKNKYGVEIHKKFSLPVACILFILIGAPLGTLFKKGSFPVAVVLGFGFFLIYYIFMIAGEEMADRNLITPFIAMWTVNILFLVIGLYLTMHTVRERAPVSFRIPKLPFINRNPDSEME